jgi:hypothetical protein
LIRYEISDIVALPFRRLAAVEGRSDDVVHLPGCLGGAVAVPPHQLRAPVAIGAALPPIRVDAVAEIPRETGPGAKLKTVVVRPR